MWLVYGNLFNLKQMLFFLIWLYILSLKYLSQGIHFSLWGKVSWYFLVCCFVWFCCLHAKSRADGFKYSVFCLVTKSADFQILGLSHVWVVRFKFLVLFLCGFFLPDVPKFLWCHFECVVPPSFSRMGIYWLPDCD